MKGPSVGRSANRPHERDADILLILASVRTLGRRPLTRHFICFALLLILFALSGCRHRAAPQAVQAEAALAPPIATTPDKPDAPDLPNPPLPLDLDRDALTRSLIDSLQKRVMGRREARRDIAWVSREIRPLVAAAARQPEVENGLRVLAARYGISTGAMRERWTDWQEADLLLEAGGNADAVSPAQAAGVAQWLTTTAQRNGLVVKTAESARLTAEIDLRRWKIAWAEYRLRPDFDPQCPGNPGYDRAKAEKQLPTLRAETENLRAKRRKIDLRYDPRAAIFAQSRYLLRLAARFPSADWLFQAYHGGEGGVTRTLKDFLGAKWPGTSAAAIEFGKNGGLLTFEDVYFEAAPSARPEAFTYLYGRSDDHRHYWWKLRAAQQALALYRRDGTAFDAAWRALLPGRSKAALWFPDAANRAFANFSDVESALKSGALVPVISGGGLTIRPPEIGADHAALLQTLRPESRGGLLLLNSLYRRAGGATNLEVADLTRTNILSEQRKKAKRLLPVIPPKRIFPPEADSKDFPGIGPPPGFDFHTAGIAFDILRPDDPKTRKILDYALGQCEDREILWHYEEKDFTPARCVIVPNPRYAAALRDLRQ